MAGLLDVGYVTPAGQDVLPSTGPHLDVRVYKDGKTIDPGTIRSLLTRLKVGKEKTPLWQQTGDQWKPSFQITSGYGNRTAPTAGASTFHPAHDYGIAGNTPISWEGPGTFTAGKGYGSIQTTDPQGNPYEIRLLHTKGGKPAKSVDQSIQTAQQPPQRQGDTYIFLRGSKPSAASEGDFLDSYISSMLQPPQVKSAFNPLALLTQAFNAPQDYMT